MSSYRYLNGANDEPGVTPDLCPSLARVPLTPTLKIHSRGRTVPITGPKSTGLNYSFVRFSLVVKVSLSSRESAQQTKLAIGNPV